MGESQAERQLHHGKKKGDQSGRRVYSTFKKGRFPGEMGASKENLPRKSRRYKRVSGCKRSPGGSGIDFTPRLAKTEIGKEAERKRAHL